jgi:hypothetical protein
MEKELTVVGLLAVAITWLVRRLSATEKRLRDAYSRESGLRDRRAEELVEHARQLAVNNEVVEDALRKHDVAVGRLEEAVDELKKAIDEVGKIQ